MMKMKKYLLCAFAAIAFATVMTSRATASERKVEVLDWKGRESGEKQNPEWLKLMVRGNATKYMEAYGLSDEYGNDKWFVGIGSDSSLATAEAIADSDVFVSLAREMSPSIFTNEKQDKQKATIINFCFFNLPHVRLACLGGFGKRGTYWHLVRTTDEDGSAREEYYFYTFYSLSSDIYELLSVIYYDELLSLEKSNKFDEFEEPTVAIIMTIYRNVEQILRNVRNENGKFNKAKLSEYKQQYKQSYDALFPDEKTRRPLSLEDILQLSTK